MKRAKRVPVRALLDSTQMRWLGALLLAGQLPQAHHLPFWTSLIGVGLVVFRLWLQKLPLAERDRMLARIPSYVLALFAIGIGVALRQSYGIFLGRDPCVGFLFVLVGIKFVEARTVRDGTLLVCLASFLLVTPFFFSQSMIAGVAAIPGLIILTACLQFLAPPAQIKPENRLRDPLRRSARLLIEGVPLALILFVVFPRLSAPLWGLPTDFMTRTGLSESMKPGSISELSRSDAVAFRVDFDGRVPPAPQRYWRGPVFTHFDGDEWTPSPSRIPARPMRARGSSISYQVTMEPTYKRSLFALDFPAANPSRLDESGPEGPMDLAVVTPDQQLIAQRAVTQPLRYSVLSTMNTSYPVLGGQAGDLERTESLQLPPGSKRTHALAESLRAAHPKDAEYIDAVLAWYRSQPFYYTLSPPKLETDPTDRFLFETRRGFCEHYAGSFVMLLRAAGIPARVVTGYQAGEVNPNGGYLIVRQSDAHAWAEAIVDGRWVRYDPTATVAPSRIELGLGGALPQEDRVPFFARQYGFLKRMQLAWDAVNYDWRRHVVDFNAEQQETLWRRLRLDTLSPWQVVVCVSLLTAIWAGSLLLWFRLRHRQRNDRVVLIWNGLCKRLARAGLPRAPYEGPLAYVGRAATRWPAFAAAFAVIGESYAELRYGRAATGAEPIAERAFARLRHAVAVVPGARTLRNSGAV